MNNCVEAYLNLDKPPGLLKRKITEDCSDYVIITEYWDLTVENCPLVSVNKKNYQRDIRIGRLE